MSTIGKAIQRLRKSQGLTQIQLSKLTGFNQNTISNHERGNRSVDEIDINIYAKALGVSPKDLFASYDDGIELVQYIGSRIKYYRKLNKMNQDELAIVLNTTKQSVSRYEKGIRKASQDILFQMCDIFNVTIDDFFPNKKDDSNKTLDYLMVVLKTLNADRQSKVYDFAMKQLKEQNEEN